MTNSHYNRNEPIQTVSLPLAWIFQPGGRVSSELQPCHFDRGSCSWAGSGCDSRVAGAGFHASGGSFVIVGAAGGGQVGAGRALTARQALITSSVQGQSARRWSQRLRCLRVKRAGRCSSR